MKLLWIIVLLATACYTPKDWDRGVPRSGVKLAPNERIEEYAKFVPTRMNSQGIWIREQDDFALYTPKSFIPVADRIDPTIGPHLNDGKFNADVALGFVIAASLISTTVLPRHAGENFAARMRHSDQVLGFLAVGVCFGGKFYFGGQADHHFDQAKSLFINGLDQRLFPNR